MTRPCDHLGICQSRACGQCGRWPADAGPTLPYRTDDDPPPTRGERIVQVATTAAWAVCLVVTLTLLARTCGGGL